MNDKLTLGVGLALEIQHALNRNGFESLDEVKALTSGDFLGRVRDVQRGLAEIKPVEHAIDLGADPFLPNNDWKVEEHQKSGIAKLERRGDDLYLDGKKIEFWLSQEQKGKSVVTGNILRTKLSKKLVLNANALDYLLKNPQVIPDSWKQDENGNTRYIFFWGTVYRFSGGGLCVRCLRWDDGAWDWDCHWLGSDWGGFDPAAVSAS